MVSHESKYDISLRANQLSNETYKYMKIKDKVYTVLKLEKNYIYYKQRTTHSVNKINHTNIHKQLWMN